MSIRSVALAGVVVLGLSAGSAGSAAAGVYQGVGSYALPDGNWTVTWTGVTCFTMAQTIGGQPVVLTVNGSNYSTNAVNVQTAADHISAAFISNGGNPTVPNGALSRITVSGNTSFDCGGNTFLLPGYVAPVSVPTLSEWAMILLGGGLAVGAVFTVQRRRRAV